MPANKPNAETEFILTYIEKYLDELNDPDEPLGKKTLARIIVRENPDQYNEKDIERIRQVIRDHCGVGRKGMVPKFDVQSADKGKAQKRASMPESQAKEQKALELPSGVLGILSDIHLPYHNPHAIACAVKYMQDEGCDQILFNGDVLDFWKISRFVKQGVKPDTVEEIYMGRQFFEWIREQFPDVPMWFKLGNHDVRWVSYLWEKGGELAKVMDEEWGPTLGLAHFLRLGQHNIQIVEDRKLIKAGKLNILHGHEFGGSFFNPVNAARGLFMRSKASTLAGHNHQTSEHQEGNLNGDAIACWSTGCLCELTPEYRPFAYTKWNLGAAIVEHQEDGSFFVDNFRIIESRRGGYRIA